MIPTRNTMTTYLDKSTFDSKLYAITESIQDTYSRIDTLFHQDLYVLDKKSVHFINDLLQPKDLNNSLERVFFSTLLNAIIQSETISGNSAHFALTYATSLSKSIQKANMGPSTDFRFAGSTEASRGLNEALTKIVQAYSTTNVKEQDLRSIIEGICGSNDVVLAEAIWRAVELAGLEGKIFIEEGARKNKNFVVELKSGHAFDLLPFNSMNMDLAKRAYIRHDAKVFLVDGIIEKVSEIDQLLMKAQETKQSLVMIAHGFGEEVVATCRANNERGNFDVMPIRIKSDIQSLNQISDIGAVCGCSPITFQSGQLLSMVKWEDLPSVAQISINQTETTFINRSTVGSVQAQIKMILGKKFDGGNGEQPMAEDLHAIYDKRLKTLVSTSVVIQLPDETVMNNDSSRIKIDLALRNVKAAMSHGILTVSLGELVEALEKEVGDQYRDNVFLTALRETAAQMEKTQANKKKGTFFSSLGLLTSTMIVGNTIPLFLNSAGCVIIANN